MVQKHRNRILGMAFAGIGVAVYGFTISDHPRVASAYYGNPTYLHETGVSCIKGQVTTQVAAVLRNDGQGWYALNDLDHTPINIKSVESDARSIRVNFSFSAKDVNTFLVTSDETLTLSGISGGASVGAESATIVLSGTKFLGNVRLSPLRVTTERFPLSNLWVFGLFEADCS